MRAQPYTRIIDARTTQQCYIVHLACRHNLRVTERVAFMSRIPLGKQTTFECPHCPDLPAVLVKSATTLWKEAGEPDV